MGEDLALEITEPMIECLESLPDLELQSKRLADMLFDAREILRRLRGFELGDEPTDEIAIHHAATS